MLPVSATAYTIYPGVDGWQPKLSGLTLHTFSSPLTAKSSRAASSQQNGRHKKQMNISTKTSIAHRSLMHYIDFEREQSDLTFSLDIIIISYCTILYVDRLSSCRRSVICCRIYINILIKAFRDARWVVRALFLWCYNQMASNIHQITNLCLRQTLYIHNCDGSLCIGRNNDALKNDEHCEKLYDCSIHIVQYWSCLISIFSFLVPLLSLNIYKQVFLLIFMGCI